jgi:hypothetical protein
MDYRPTNAEEQRIYAEPNVPIIAGTYRGAVRIIGSGSGMWNDYAESERIMPGTDTIGINIACMVIPHLTHLFSWHPKQLSAIKQWRMAEWPDDKSIVHAVVHNTGREIPFIDAKWQFNGATSVSGMTACELAWLLGYRKIVLVGVPQDEKGYFYKPMDNPDLHDKYRTREIFKLNEFFGGAVKSFSGNTKRVLGEPDTEWLGA